MAVYIDNKKYAILQTPKIKNQDITVTTNGNYYPSDEYTGFGLVRVKFPDPIYEEITVTPSIETQEILPSEGTDAISKVTVNPVTSDIDENIKPENIVKGTTILGVEGTFEFITETLEVSPSMKVQTFTPNEDVDGFSTVTIKAITSAIDEDIKPENIKKDVEILGVTGTVIEVNNTTRDITENGVYTPEEPYTGFSEVTVDINTVNNTDIVIDKDGEYIPEEPYTGFGKVTVKVTPVTSEITVEPTETITVLEAKENETGYSKVTIDLTWIEQALKELNAGDKNTEESILLQDKTISTAGEFTCDDGYDGLGTVTVDLSWVDEAIEQARQEGQNVTVEGLINNTVDSITVGADLIEPYAFYHKTNLTEITLTVAERIKDYAFAESGLTKLILNSMTMCTIDNAETAFINTPIIQGLGYIYVPDSLIQEYKEDKNWSTISNRIIVKEWESSIDELNKEIAQADEIRSTLYASTNGSGIELETYWVKQDVLDAFDEIINSSKEIANTLPTLEDITTQTTTLQAEIETIESSKTEGKVYTYSKLEPWVTQAAEMFSHIDISDTGEEVVTEHHYTNSANQKTMQTTLTTAQNYVKNKNCSSQQVVLNQIEAMKTFISQIEEMPMGTFKDYFFLATELRNNYDEAKQYEANIFKASVEAGPLGLFHHYLYTPYKLSEIDGIEVEILENNTYDTLSSITVKIENDLRLVVTVDPTYCYGNTYRINMKLKLLDGSTIENEYPFHAVACRLTQVDALSSYEGTPPTDLIHTSLIMDINLLDDVQLTDWQTIRTTIRETIINKGITECQCVIVTNGTDKYMVFTDEATATLFNT